MPNIGGLAGAASLREWEKEREPHKLNIAILVDGGFFRKRYRNLFKDHKHKNDAIKVARFLYRRLTDYYVPAGSSLYRLFYYDAPPLDMSVTNPISAHTYKLANTEFAKFISAMQDELRYMRKVALRLGRIAVSRNSWVIKPLQTRLLLSGKIAISDLKPENVQLAMSQKGVDSRIGLDVASLSANGRIDVIVLISGDQDFVPVGKHARRSGIDFILDPMGAHINDMLREHIDGTGEAFTKGGVFEYGHRPRP